jgi:hypothetical protein
MVSAAVDQALRLPPDEAASQLLKLPESQWFERKSARSSQQAWPSRWLRDADLVIWEGDSPKDPRATWRLR